MIILKYAADIAAAINRSGNDNQLIGFVPTMGALHEGHISLVKKSRQVCGITVASIFINPTQFNNAEDLEKYPVTIEKDIYLLERTGCDILFLPDVREIYPNGTEINEHFDLGYLESILEGKYRPGHFQGVCQVVKRLLQIIKPTHLFLGQKDYQQCMVIKKLLALMHSDSKVVICPTLREENGLAMSSRNLRLNAMQKDRAAAIYRTLLFIQQNEGAIPGVLKEDAGKKLEENDFIVDYVEIANAADLRTVEEWESRGLVALIAASINGVRLIDNILLSE